MKGKIFIFSALILLFAFSLFVRIFFMYGTVFSDPVKFGADDAVYHMRLVENELLGNHFPKLINFDAFTFFPYGTDNNIAPFFDQLLASFILIVGLGKPSQQLINNIAPFFPAILGSFSVFIFYFLGKKLWNSKAIGLLASFLVVIAPHFLSRSILGNTDTHVAEFIFFYLAILFFLIAIKKRKSLFYENKNIKERLIAEINNERPFWIYTIVWAILSGIFFWTWAGAPLLLFVFFVFICGFYLIKFFSGKNYDWLLASGTLGFLIVFLMVFPFFGGYAKRYAFQYSSIIFSAIFGFLALILSSYFALKKKKPIKSFVIYFIGLCFLALIFIAIFFPGVLNNLWQTLLAVNNSTSEFKFAKEVTGEMRPIGIEGAFGDFGYLFFISIIGLFVCVYNFLKDKDFESFLMIIMGTVFILLSGVFPFFGQGRFELYLCGTVSLLSAYIIINGFKNGWKALELSSLADNDIKKYLSMGSLSMIFGLFFLLIFPFPVNIASLFPSNLPLVAQKTIVIAKTGLFVREKGWYDALLWLKNNTPDPLVDYYAVYDGDSKSYKYPPEAYGILTRWDYGHLIAYQAHRMPIANNFHQGIGTKENEKVTEAGQSVFFLETEESAAKKYAESLKAKYIIIDHTLINELFSSEIKQVYGDMNDDYLSLDENDEKPSKYDNSMAVKLYMLDGTRTETKRKIKGKEINFIIESLDYFRLVYESSEDALSSAELNKNLKAVKVFEYVKGAKISGKANNGVKVTLSAKIKTNQKREFEYKKEVVAEDGRFEFVVPYSTIKSASLKNQTKSDVVAEPYVIKIGNNKEIRVNVSEESVASGESIEI